MNDIDNRGERAPHDVEPSVKIVHVFHYAEERLGGAQKIIHQLHRAAGRNSRIVAFDGIWMGEFRKASSKLIALVQLIQIILFERDTFLFLHHRIFLPVTWLARRRSAFVCHNIFPSKNRVYRLFGAARCIAVSEEVQSYLVRWNPKFRVDVIVNGMSAGDGEMHEALSDEIVDVGFVGRVDHQKGADLLFAAAAKLVQSEGIPIRLHIVGEPGTMGADLLERSRAMGLPADFLTFYGYAANPFRQVRSADLICIPSRYEGFGLVFYEALERGHLVLASRLPVFHAFDWDDRTMFCEPDNVDALTDGLRTCAQKVLAGTPHSDALRRHTIPTVSAMAESYIRYAATSASAG